MKPPGSTSGHGRVFWLIVISVPVLLVVYIAMFFGFGYLYVANVQHLPVGQSEWHVVVDAQDIAEWLPGLEVSTSGKELKKDSLPRPQLRGELRLRSYRCICVHNQLCVRRTQTERRHRGLPPSSDGNTCWFHGE